MSKLFVLPIASQAELATLAQAVQRAVASDVLLPDLPQGLQTTLWDIEREAGDFFVWGRGNLPGDPETWAEVSSGDTFLLLAEKRLRFAFRVLLKLPDDLVGGVLDRAERKRSVGAPAFLVSEPEAIDQPLAVVAGTMDVSRGDISEVPRRTVAKLKKNNGTLDAFLKTTLGAIRTSAYHPPKPEAIPDIEAELAALRSAPVAEAPVSPSDTGDPELNEQLLKKRAGGRRKPRAKQATPRQPGTGMRWGLASVRRIFVDVALTAAALALLFNWGRAVLADAVWVAPTFLPPSYSEAGYYPEMVAGRMVRRVAAIEAGVIAQGRPGDDYESRAPELLLPGPRAELFGWLRALSALSSPRLESSVVETPEGDRLRLELGERVLLVPEGPGAEGPEGLIEGGAVALVRQFDPTLYARHLAVASAESLLSRKFELALAQARESVELDPSHAPAYLRLGIAWAAAGDLARAIASFEQASEIAPKFAPIYGPWADALLEQGEERRAAELLDRALALEPDNAELLVSWGRALSASKQWKAASSKFEEATRIDPDAAEAFNYWGLALRAQGDHEAAIERYRRAAQLEPEYAEALYNWGNALNAGTRYEDAIAKYQEALAVDPNFAPGYNNWGVALAGLARHEEAIAQYERAAELDPEYTEAHSNWGLALHEMRQYDAAVARFERANAIDPGSAAVYYNWGRALHAQKDLNSALEKYERAVELDPDTFAFVSSRIETLRDSP